MAFFVSVGLLLGVKKNSLRLFSLALYITIDVVQNSLLNFQYNLAYFNTFVDKLIDFVAGSQDVAHDYDILTAHKVTHIINCATGVENIFLGAIKYLTIDVLDLPWTNIEQHFDKCHKFMKEAVDGGGNVSSGFRNFNFNYTNIVVW